MRAHSSFKLTFLANSLRLFHSSTAVLKKTKISDAHSAIKFPTKTSSTLQYDASLRDSIMMINDSENLEKYRSHCSGIDWNDFYVSNPKIEKHMKAPFSGLRTPMPPAIGKPVYFVM